jgi:gluconolactonase
VKRAALALLLATGACMSVADEPSRPAIGRIHAGAPGLERLIAPDARIEKLGEGFRWSEGPVWIEEGRYLLFSDVPANKMYRWSEADGVSVFLDPSGYDGPPTPAFREPGSNGLIPGPKGTILMADHGNRAIARLDLATKKKTFLATHFQGKRFSSPNDLVLARDGTIYFTDPPYGLDGLNKSPLKEIPFNGVYRLDPDGTVTLVDDSMSFPNGIILSPDERTLYVANSDPERPIWMAFSLDGQGRVTGKRVFADVSADAKAGLPGLPDGMAIDVAGNLFATGPGGVHVFAPDGSRLGRIDTGTAVANCAFGEDGRTLFLASNNMLARVRTKTKGLGT